MNKILSNKRGEGHIDTAVKIIIAVVIGSLLLGGIYLLFTQVIMPSVNTKVQAMMDTNGELQIRENNGRIEKSIDGETWIAISLPNYAADEQVIKVESITKDDQTVWVILSQNSAMYSAIATPDLSTWYPIQSSRQEMRLSKSQSGKTLYLEMNNGMEFASTDGINWDLISTARY